MKGITRIACAAGILAGATLWAQDAAKNPALEKFAKTIVFYAPFEGKANAELSPGDGKPSAAPPADAYVPGLYGQALKSGNYDFSYLIPKDARMSRSGAAAIWVAFAPGVKHDSSYFFILRLMGNGRMVMLARMGDPANKECLYTYMEEGGKGVSATTGSTLGWKEGEWHLLVTNWRSDTFDLSIDGQPLAQARLANVPPEVPADKYADERLVVSATIKNQDAFLMDELLVFNTPLTQEEIQSLYETTKKR